MIKVRSASIDGLVVSRPNMPDCLVYRCCGAYRFLRMHKGRLYRVQVSFFEVRQHAIADIY